MDEDMREISLEESRAMSLKFEGLLEQEARITSRGIVLKRENRVELDRCIDEQLVLREIIRTGKIHIEAPSQDEIFDEDESMNFTVELTLKSAHSGMPICSIPLNDLTHFRVTAENKSAIRSGVNAVLFEVRQESLGYQRVGVTVDEETGVVGIGKLDGSLVQVSKKHPPHK